MKLIIANLQDLEENTIVQALVEKEFRVTRIASTGGFLRSRASTLLIGVEEVRLEEAILTIRTNCTPPIEPGLIRATLYIMDVERFEQI